MKLSLGEKIFNGTNNIMLGLIALTMLFPIYWVIIVSFTDPSEFLLKRIVLWPDKWSIDAYRYLLSVPAFMKSMGVSAYLAVVGTICSLAVTTSFAYALSRKKFKGRRVILMLVLFTILFGP